VNRPVRGRSTRGAAAGGSSDGCGFAARSSHSAKTGCLGFYRLSRRKLHGDTDIPVVLVAFDVLAINGTSTMSLTYRERRGILASITLGPSWYLCRI
jgi:hypothetical protein